MWRPRGPCSRRLIGQSVNDATHAWLGDRCLWIRPGEPLARQTKSQITSYFTTQMLHYHKLRLDSEDYNLEQVRVFSLPSLFVVFKGSWSCRAWVFWVLHGGLFPSIYVAQERTLHTSSLGLYSVCAIRCLMLQHAGTTSRVQYLDPRFKRDWFSAHEMKQAQQVTSQPANG